MTPGGKKNHAKHVNRLKLKLGGYGVNPFSPGAPRHISTGEEIDKQIVNDVLRAPLLGK